MYNVWVIFKREIGQYFASPIAYLVAFAMLFLGGLGFVADVQRRIGRAPADGTAILSFFAFIMIFFAPLLTMRLLAEESREGTLEVLMTLPIRESQFIIGKFLAVWAYYTIILVITVVYHIILTQIGVPDLGAAFGAYFGAWLYGGAVLALTMIWSAMTEDQIVAAFLGAATVLVLYLAELAASWLANLQGVAGASDFIRELGLRAHYDITLARGIIRAEDLLYFAFLIIGALFITTRIVETRRWRS